MTRRPQSVKACLRSGDPLRTFLFFKHLSSYLLSKTLSECMLFVPYLKFPCSRHLILFVIGVDEAGADTGGVEVIGESPDQIMALMT